MELLKIYNCDGGFTYKGKKYEFTDIDSVTYTPNKKNSLVRGANAKNKRGIAFKTGLKSPDMAQYQIVDCSIEIYRLLQEIFEKGSRVDAWFIDRTNGNAYTCKEAVISSEPVQTTIGEGEDSIGFVFEVSCFEIERTINDENE